MTQYIRIFMDVEMLALGEKLINLMVFIKTGKLLFSPTESFFFRM